VDALAGLRRLLDAARVRRPAPRGRGRALVRARAAVEDRTGPEREEARRRLNRASLEAEEAGAAADAAWEAWRQGVQELLARTG
jgi:hypothetical protein